MQAWTDQIFTDFGEKEGEAAKSKEVEIISFDGYKFCNVLLGDFLVEVSINNLYKKSTVDGSRESITKKDLISLVSPRR